MILQNSGQSANGFAVSAQGIQISTEKGGSTASPKNCVIELNNRIFEKYTILCQNYNYIKGGYYVTKILLCRSKN